MCVGLQPAQNLVYPAGRRTWDLRYRGQLSAHCCVAVQLIQVFYVGHFVILFNLSLSPYASHSQLRDENNSTRRQTQFYVGQGKTHTSFL